MGLKNHSEAIAIEILGASKNIHVFSYHVSATGSIWLASGSLGWVLCDWYPWAIINVVWAKVHRTHNHSVLILAEMKGVPHLREDETGLKKITKQLQQKLGNKKYVRHRWGLTQKFWCKKRINALAAWPVFPGAVESRSPHRLVVQGTGGQVCPSASLTGAAGRWLWSGHSATGEIEMYQIAYQMVHTTNIPFKHNTSINKIGDVYWSAIQQWEQMVTPLWPALWYSSLIASCWQPSQWYSPRLYGQATN